MIEKNEYRHYKIAAVLSICLAAALAVFIIINGKDNGSLIINNFNSPPFDFLFTWLTYLGDGITWVPVILYVLFFKRDFLLAVIAAIIISTFITQFLKHAVFPNELRPIRLLKDQLHIIKGIQLNTANSFPSGHTSEAFTIATLLAFIIHRYFWTFFLPLVAFFVGYSRVYLAQHFVTDVLAGIVIGIISTYFTILIHKYYIRKKHHWEELKKNI